MKYFHLWVTSSQRVVELSSHQLSASLFELKLRTIKK